MIHGAAESDTDSAYCVQANTVQPFPYLLLDPLCTLLWFYCKTKPFEDLCFLIADNELKLRSSDLDTEKCSHKERLNPFLNFIHHAGLYLNRLLVNEFQKVICELCVQPHGLTQRNTCLYDLFPARNLEDRHVVFFLVLSDLFADLHTGSELLHDLIIENIYLF